MVADDGYEVGFHGEYREIISNERIVTTESMKAYPRKCPKRKQRHWTPQLHRNRRAHHAHDPHPGHQQGGARTPIIDSGMEAACRTRSASWS